MAVEKSTGKKFNPKLAWITFFVVFITGIALSWSANKIVPILQFIQADLGVSAQVAGWISGLFNIMGAVLAFPAAGIVRKFGYRITGIVSLLCTLIGGVIGFFAPNEVILLISRIIEGLGIGLIAVMAPALTAAWFPADKRSLPMGIWSTWQAVVVACVFLFTGNILGPDSQWKNMYILGIALAIIALILFFIFVKTPEPENDFGEIEDTSINMFVVLKNPSTWFITLVFFAFGIACMAFASWVSTFWGQVAGWDVLYSNRVIGLMYAGEVVTCILGGFVIGKLKTIAIRKWFVVIWAVVYTCCFFALYTVTTPGSIYFACVMFVIAEGVFCAGMWYFVTLVPTHPSLNPPTTAMVAIGQNLGMMMGAPIGGAILDATGMTGWSELAILVTVCMAISTISMALLKLRDPNKQ